MRPFESLGPLALCARQKNPRRREEIAPGADLMIDICSEWIPGSSSKEGASMFAFLSICQWIVAALSFLFAGNWGASNL